MPPQPTPITLPFPRAPAAILAHAREHHAADSHILIGITGPVGSGKSTVARTLAEHAGAPDSIVRTDDFLPDYDHVPYHERDEPARADLAALAGALAALRAGRPARVPIWSHHTHRREGERDIHPAPIITVEGIHALHEQVAAHLHIQIYVEAPAATRWARWEAIERAGGRGMGLEAAKRFFHEVAEPTFNKHGARARDSAHFIVINDQPENRE